MNEMRKKVGRLLTCFVRSDRHIGWWDLERDERYQYRGFYQPDAQTHGTGPIRREDLPSIAIGDMSFTLPRSEANGYNASGF